MSERNGRLTVDGDRAVLNFERRLPFPIDVVWSAITDPDERGQWFGETTIDAREGGMIEMVATGPPLPPERKRMTGRILVWDPPNVLEHEWKQPIVEDGVVRYELTADGDGTVLRFTHRGLGVRNASGFLGGTHAFLDRLEAYLSGGELPDWTTRRQEVNQQIGVELTWTTMALTLPLLPWRSPITRASGTLRCWPTRSRLERERQAPT